MTPVEVDAPVVVMVLLLTVLPVAVTTAVAVVRHWMVMVAVVAAAVLELPVTVLPFMFNVVGLPPEIRSMVPVPATALLVTVLLLRFTVAAEAELMMPLNRPVVAVA